MLCVECPLCCGGCTPTRVFTFLRDVREPLWPDVSCRTGIRVYTRIRQLQPVVHNGIIVQHLAAHNPVATVEASKVRASVAQTQICVHVSKHEPVADSRAD